MNSASPCMTCVYRSPNCHGLCEAYKNWATSQYEAKRRTEDAYFARQYVPETLKKHTYEQWKSKARRGRGKIT